MKMSLAHTNALLVATTDLDHAKRRANGALTQVALLHEDAKNPQELQARASMLTADLRAILARIASAESRVRVCLHEGDAPPEDPAQAPVVAPVAPVAPAAPARLEPTPAKPAMAPQAAPPSSGNDPLYEDFEGVRIRVGAPKPRAGYVHYRSRRHVIAEALEVGIPAEVIHHNDLMTPNLKPTALGWKRAEKLITQVREAESKKVAPDKLWQKWIVK